MKRFILLLLLLLSFQTFAQWHKDNNGMVDIKLVATDALTGEIIPYAVFKLEIDGEQTEIISNSENEIVNFQTCPQKVISKTLVFTAYGYACDSLIQNLNFRIIEDTTLYFALNRNASISSIASDYLRFRATFCNKEVSCSWIEPLSNETPIYYQHCDCRIAVFDAIPEEEFLAGSWQLMKMKNQLIARCPSGQCEQSDSVMYVSPIGDTIVPYGEMEYLGYRIISDYGIVRKLYPDGTSEWIGINNKGEYLFDIYFFDNGPDYTVEGRFRIKKDGKIGFANEKGEIVIEPQFECTDYFREGRARVTFDCTLIPSGEYKAMKSDTWFYIDLDGNIVE